MPYTSRDEITTAVEACVRDFIANGCNERYAFILVSLVSRNSYFILVARPITERDINDHLMTSLGESPPLDILIRTSGVNRLSDFLLWQVRSVIHFLLATQSISLLSQVLRTDTTAVHTHLLAGIWTLWLYPYHLGLSAKSMEQSHNYLTCIVILCRH